MATPGFGGRRVLALEARRGAEMATLIGNAGGVATVAAAVEEMAVEAGAQRAELAFAAAVERGGVDLAVFLTGTGVRGLMEALNARGIEAAERFLAALRRIPVAARSPKPAAALRAVQVEPALIAPEPHTWRELLAALEAAPEVTLRHARVAVQEYGAPNPELAAALTERGARVTTFAVYRWKLPEDLGPLRAAMAELAAGGFAAAIFTNAVQIAHLFQVAEETGQADAVRRGLQQTLIASIGPTTTEELRRRGLAPGLEASRPRMGVLVLEAAQRVAAQPGV